MKLLRILSLGLLEIDPDVERHGVDIVLDSGEVERVDAADGYIPLCVDFEDGSLTV